MARSTYRKKITSEELISEISPENKKLINRYIKYISQRRSDKTVKVYTSNFDMFFCWNVENNDNKFFIDIKKSEFDDFFNYGLDELQWSPNRFANIHSSLSSFCKYIEDILDEDYPNFRNKISKIEKPTKNAVREKTILSDAQIDNLFKYLREIDRPQEELLLALAIGSGARISELFRFTTDIIDEENVAFEGLFLETTNTIKTKGFGKQGEAKYKYIIKDLFLPYYKAWLPIREEIMKEKGQKHNHIFIRQDGTPATDETGRSWMKKWERYLSNDDPSNPEKKPVNLYMHCLRHRIVTHLTKIGLEPDFIIELMGWKSREMYSIYNDLTAKEKKWKNLDNIKNLF